MQAIFLAEEGAARQLPRGVLFTDTSTLTGAKSAASAYDEATQVGHSGNIQTSSNTMEGKRYGVHTEKISLCRKSLRAGRGVRSNKHTSVRSRRDIRRSLQASLCMFVRPDPLPPWKATQEIQNYSFAAQESMSRHSH